MEHYAMELRPEDGVDDDKENHHRGRDPGGGSRRRKARDQYARDQRMGRLETDPCREAEGQSRKLDGEQACDAGKKGHCEQQDRVLQEENDAGHDEWQQGKRVGEVVAELLRLDQEQLRDPAQRSPELSHVEHCSRAFAYSGSLWTERAKAWAESPELSAILTPFFRAPT